LTEYWFYHLETSNLEGVLPGLLEKTLERGWQALVKLPEERLKEMDTYLWTYKDQSFLPHGRDDEPMAEAHPIRLSASAQTTAGANCVFLIEGQDIDDLEDAERCIIMINGRSEEDVARARQKWKTLKKAGETISYWKQDDRGQWTKAG